MSTSEPGQEAEVLTEQDWHGWTVGDVSVHVGPLPGRKSVCLYAVNGGALHTLAFFRTEYDAQSCLWFLDKLARSRPGSGAP